MHVAYLCADPGVPVFGSEVCSTQVLEFVRALLAEGQLVTLLAARVENPRPIDLARVTVEHFPVARSGKPAVREREAFRANKLHLSVLRSGSTVDLVYERYSLWSYAGMAYAQEAGIPGILEVNAPLIDEQTRCGELINRELAESVARRTFRDATDIVAASKEVADYLNLFPEAEGKVVVIPRSKGILESETVRAHQLPLQPDTVGRERTWIRLPVDPPPAIRESQGGPAAA